MADIMRCVDVRSLWNAKLILSVLEGGMLAQIVRALRAYGSVYTKSSEMAFSSGLKKTLWSGESEYLRFAYCERLTHVPLNPGGAPASLVFLCLQTYGKEDNALATLPILVSYVKLKSVRAVTLSMAVRFASRNTVLVALAVNSDDGGGDNLQRGNSQEEEEHNSDSKPNSQAQSTSIPKGHKRGAQATPCSQVILKCSYRLSWMHRYW